MDISVDPSGTLSWPTGRVRCALGRGGITTDKHEGDLATPLGCFALRQVFYRPDRETKPDTRLPVHALSEHDGWCDDPGDPAYNTHVTLPHPARHERLWRDDAIYDLIVVLGYNDDPVIAGAGSAIFLHIARDDYTGTEGCVAVRREDLRALLSACAPGDTLSIAASD